MRAAGSGQLRTRNQPLSTKHYDETQVTSDQNE